MRSGQGQRPAFFSPSLPLSPSPLFRLPDHRVGVRWNGGHPPVYSTSTCLLECFTLQCSGCHLDTGSKEGSVESTLWTLERIGRALDIQVVRAKKTIVVRDREVWRWARR